MYIRKSVEEGGRGVFLKNKRKNLEDFLFLFLANGVLGRRFLLIGGAFGSKKVLSANVKVTGRVLGLC